MQFPIPLHPADKISREVVCSPHSRVKRDLAASQNRTGQARSGARAGAVQSQQWLLNMTVWEQLLAQGVSELHGSLAMSSSSS